MDIIRLTISCVIPVPVRPSLHGITTEDRQMEIHLRHQIKIDARLHGHAGGGIITPDIFLGRFQ